MKLDDVIAYLKVCAHDAYSMGFMNAADGYDRAATRLFAAGIQGEFEKGG